MNLVSISTGKIFKITKSHEPVGQVQFVVFGKFTGAYYTKLQEKSYYYLLIIYMKKKSQEVKTDDTLTACSRYL